MQLGGRCAECLREGGQEPEQEQDRHEPSVTAMPILDSIWTPYSNTAIERDAGQRLVWTVMFIANVCCKAMVMSFSRTYRGNPIGSDGRVFYVGLLAFND